MGASQSVQVSGGTTADVRGGSRSAAGAEAGTGLLRLLVACRATPAGFRRVEVVVAAMVVVVFMACLLCVSVGAPSERTS